MITAEAAGIAAALVATAGTVFAGIRWMVKSFLHELVPNSGSSLHDKITRLEGRIDEIYKIIAER